MHLLLGRHKIRKAPNFADTCFPTIVSPDHTCPPYIAHRGQRTRISASDTTTFAIELSVEPF